MSEISEQLDPLSQNILKNLMEKLSTNEEQVTEEMVIRRALWLFLALHEKLNNDKGFDLILVNPNGSWDNINSVVKDARS